MRFHLCREMLKIKLNSLTEKNVEYIKKNEELIEQNETFSSEIKKINVELNSQVILYEELLQNLYILLFF